MKKRPSHGGSSRNQLQRRDFIKQAGFSALGGSLTFGLADMLFSQQGSAPAAGAPVAPVVKYETLNQLDGMSYVSLGRTNLMVSRMALGGIPWQPIVARKAINMGVNLVHGSNEYGTMADQYRALEKDWGKFWYALKYNTGSEANMTECLENCLKTIKQDHVDIVLPTVYEVKTANYDKLVEEFEILKKAGKVRFMGATIHAGRDLPGICREVIDKNIFDIILTMYQPDNKPGLDKELVRAIEKNIGVMSMKTLQGTKTAADRAATFQAALSDGTIHSVLKGNGDMGDLNSYLGIAGKTPMPSHPRVSQGRPCGDSELCGGCGLCSECPQGVEIAEVMRCATYYAPQGWDQYAAWTYRQLSKPQTVLGCIDCGLCEQQCPRSLAIRQTLRWAHQRWA